MSLAPQRPNFVLIWIGIIMLTFSLVGSWMLGPDVVRSRDSGDFATDYGLMKEVGGPTGLTTPSSGDLAADPAFFDQVLDQAIPLHIPQPHRLEDMLAEAGLLTEAGVAETGTPPSEAGAATHGPAPLVADQDAEVLGLPQEQQQDLLDPAPDYHAFTEATYRKGKKAKRRQRWSEQGQYHLTAGGSGKGKQGAARRIKDLPHKGGREIILRTAFIPLAKDRLMVRFSLEPPSLSDRDRILDRLAAEELAEQRLAARSRQLLQSLEDVLDEDDTEEEQAKRLKLQRMKAKLAAHLKQRPGGLELVAELSPAQLEALFQKLNARNQGLRALIEG